MQVDTHNKEFQDALNLIQYTRQSVFLTGKAGTGKSTFLKYVCEVTKKKHIVLAPTGIAAINAGGSTLHSFFKLPFYPLLPDDPKFSLTFMTTFCPALSNRIITFPGPKLINMRSGRHVNAKNRFSSWPTVAKKLPMKSSWKASKRSLTIN